jgi:hypothetical protein
MLAQLVTDEAKPGSREKWFVDFVMRFFGDSANNQFDGRL